MKKLTQALACLSLSFASVAALSQSDEDWSQFTAVDKDGDGLIEISSLEMLNEVRNNPKGNALFGSSSGCPASGCVGFELTQDLDFDTNRDRKIDRRDSFWNNGEGWDPIWFFEGIFEGNNHTIKNLFIDRQTAPRAGLFGWTDGATIRNLRVSGSVRGARMVGGIVGHLANSEIENSVSSADIHSTGSSTGGLVGASTGSTIVGNSTSGSVTGVEVQVGGLVGHCGDSVVIKNFSSASVKGSMYVGGLVGHSMNSTYEENIALGDVEGAVAGGLVSYFKDSSATNNYTNNRVRAETGAGGLIGISTENSFITNNYTASAVTQVESYKAHGTLIGALSAGELQGNYWTTDTSNISNQSAAGGATLAELKCPTRANNTACADIVLYDSWDSRIWDFGTSIELPRLRTTSNFPWTSRDTPNASGDHERDHHLKEEHSDRYCDDPIAIEASIDGRPIIYRSEPSRVFKHFDVLKGLACVKNQQPNGQCDDYEVSYLCSEGWSSWRSKDTPGGEGDYEYRKDFSGCDGSGPFEIRARKKNSSKVIYGTPDVLKHFSTTEGLACENNDQKKYKSDGCNDYKVRLVCPTSSEV